MQDLLREFGVFTSLIQDVFSILPSFFVSLLFIVPCMYAIFSIVRYFTEVFNHE